MSDSDEKYELFKTEGGAVVYRLREELVKRGEVEHFVCPTCYDNQRGRYILQPDKEQSTFLRCSGGCEGRYRFYRPPPIAARVV